MKLKENAIAHASVLANRYEMPPCFISNIMEGRLHYSLALYPHGGACVEIDRDSDSYFAMLVKDFEENLNAYVYHAILSGPFLSLLFVSEQNNENWKTPSPLQDEVGAAVLDIDNREIYFMDIRLQRCEDALMRVD